ncbi:hypothetical protein [Legionella gresilensis]|uniref:hypothetical protein n=1 Tax=Legionella gresilensis TaxID=91823 RepID=UPI001041412A|nr:hypothetical protein [Legionella gresilensis]
MQTLTEYESAVSKDWRNLRAVPFHLTFSLSMQDRYRLLEKAIEQSPEALELFPRPVDSNNISNEHLAVYLKALNHPHFTVANLRLLPLPNLTTAGSLSENQLKLLEKAATINHLAILGPLSQISPLNQPTLYGDYLQLLERLIVNDHPNLREKIGAHFPHQGSEFSPREIAIYIAFAQKYPEGIRNVRNEAIKNLMIEHLGVKHFIQSDLTLISAMPAKYIKEAKEVVRQSLAGKSQIIITPPPPNSDELKAVYNAYSNQNHPGQCVRLTSSHLEVVKDILAEAGRVNENKPTLVFMGPTLGDSTRIADYDANQIAECVKAQGKVQRVVLMGYNTAGVTGSVEDKKGLLAQVAGAFKEAGIQGVNVSAFKGEGYYSFAHSSYALFSSNQAQPSIVGQVSEIKYTSP